VALSLLGALSGLAGGVLALVCGELAGLAGLRIVGEASLAALVLWFAGSGLAGAAAGALAFRAARSVEPVGPRGRA
jgi:hypothetical protein